MTDKPGYYSLLSSVVSMAGGTLGTLSLYFTYLNVGAISVMPLKMYKVEPYTAGQTRTFKVTAPMTFINTGAGQKVIADLRIRVVAPEGDIVLDWVEELDQLPIFLRRNQENQPRYPFQPTLNDYESISRIYGFRTKKKYSDAIKALEKSETENHLDAHIELRTATGDWIKIGGFKLSYSGRIMVQYNYADINGIDE